MPRGPTRGQPAHTVRAADGDGVCSFGKLDGKVHALDHGGLFIAEAARLDEVIEGVREGGERKVL